MQIDADEFGKAIAQLNEIFDEAESITPKVVLENMLGCLSAYLIFLCIPTNYEKCLRRVSKKVLQLNTSLFVPQGLLMIDPAERGLRVIEVCIMRSDRSPSGVAKPGAINGQVRQPLLATSNNNPLANQINQIV
ncbi:Golgin subfamily A member 7 [Cichlidogyrus casuarinus]|uniref:Ras modification protein ERF4 n=1 Tax=Cichlidogyrus casuarinus TaxID=1844966 RepID=A0ABD2QM96_9PLAT